MPTAQFLDISMDSEFGSEYKRLKAKNINTGDIGRRIKSELEVNGGFDLKFHLDDVLGGVG